MKSYKMIRKYALLPLLALVIGVTQSCKEDIDMSDRYTFKEYTIASYHVPLKITIPAARDQSGPYPCFCIRMP